jgi:CBS domain-containing protein
VLIKEEAIRLISVKTCAPTDTIVDLAKIIENHPVLVVKEFNGETKLLGIVTPFDLL